MKKQKLVTLVLGMVLVLAIVFSSSGGSVPDDATVKAEILKVLQTTETTQTLEVKFLDGELAGEIRTIENDEQYSADRRIFEEGDRVIMQGDYIVDYFRFSRILVLFGLFMLVVMLVTGFQGIGALIGMGLSFLVIFKLVLPQILIGRPPVLMAILGSILIIPLTFYSSHGFSKKTNIAIFGTFVTLVVAGVLATFFADYLHLTGFASEEISYLKMTTTQGIDFQGLILAGILISILGVLDDITISQASVVQQLKLAKTNIKFPELFARAMSVGRDHIASLVNTLILVYAGASLPLLLLFLDYSTDFQSVINLEFIAEEIVRTIIGSIGLILAVPITTLLAAFISAKGVKAEHHHH